MSGDGGQRVIPNFFIVGAPKCGTTSLHEYLRQHPDVFLPEFKEPKFFCTDLYYGPSHIVDGEQAYHELFRPGVGARAVGEASTGYLYSRVAPGKIKAFNPEARIIISLRNPADMMYSNHRHLVSIGHQDLEDFQQALDSEEARSQTNTVPAFCAVPPQFLRYRWMASYSPHVKKYLEAFGQDRVHVVIFDDLKNHPGRTYRGLLEFLEVDPEFVPEFRVYNVGSDKRARNLAWKRYLRAHHGVRGAIKRVYRVAGPLVALLPLGKLLSLALGEVKFPEKLDPTLRDRLQQELKPEVQRLERILDRDLSFWY